MPVKAANKKKDASGDGWPTCGRSHMEPTTMAATIRQLAKGIERGTIAPNKNLMADGAYCADFKAELPAILIRIAEHLEQE